MDTGTSAGVRGRHRRTGAARARASQPSSKSWKATLYDLTLQQRLKKTQANLRYVRPMAGTWWAYFALVNLSDHSVQAATDARDAGWFGVHDVPTLAFDHAEIEQVRSV